LVQVHAASVGRSATAGVIWSYLCAPVVRRAAAL